MSSGERESRTPTGAFHPIPATGRTEAKVVLISALLVAAILVGHEIAVRLVGSGETGQIALLLLRIGRGLALSAVLAGAVARHFYSRWGRFVGPLDDKQVERGIDREQQLRDYALWFVQVRWIVVAGLLGLISIARPPSFLPLMGWWLALIAVNLVFEYSGRRMVSGTRQLMLQMACDLVILTGLLNASGGLENPLYTAYLFSVIVGRVFLPVAKARLISILAGALFAFLAFGEYSHLLPHYTNVLFPHATTTVEVDSVSGSGHTHAEGDHASFDLFFVWGRTIPFLLALLLADLIMARVVERLRWSEGRFERAARSALFERKRLEGVVNASGIGMLQADPEATIRWFSGKMGEWFSWGPSVTDKTCPLLGAEEGCSLCVVQETARTGVAAAQERSQTLSTGGQKHFRHSSSPVRDEDGKVIQIVEVIEDATSRKALEIEAIKAGKLSVLGRMAAGIAHEIGNPLSSISSRLSLLARHRDEEFVVQSVDVLRTQIERITRIVHGVSHFARTKREDQPVWKINPLLEEMIDVLEIDSRVKKVRFVRDFGTPSALVSGVRDQVGQIVLNLLLNAAESMPDGGEVTVSSATRDGEVAVAIADQGPGIDEAERESLFEPFFTTKDEGTGLGLSISFSLAEAHGGRIELDDGAEEGSRFLLFLPMADGGAAATAPRRAEAGPS